MTNSSWLDTFPRNRTIMSEPTNDARKSTVLYKILTDSEYEGLPKPDDSGRALFSGTSFDLGGARSRSCDEMYSHNQPLLLTDGFIHTSSAEQLPKTLNRFFEHSQTVWILAIPRTEKIEKILKVRAHTIIPLA
jgi:hypothetical protein